eukprot:8058306-Lingulodinium_polyedra.AAC.1
MWGSVGAPRDGCGRSRAERRRGEGGRDSPQTRGRTTSTTISDSERGIASKRVLQTFESKYRQ